jgi:DNA-binding NtrC family response regulator
LRERRSDIPLLVNHFIAQFNQLRRTEILGMEPDALSRMTEEEWPGNIRELENMIERLCVLKKRGMITLSDCLSGGENDGREGGRVAGAVYSLCGRWHQFDQRTGAL